MVELRYALCWSTTLDRPRAQACTSERSSERNAMGMKVRKKHPWEPHLDFVGVVLGLRDPAEMHGGLVSGGLGLAGAVDDVADGVQHAPEGNW